MTEDWPAGLPERIEGQVGLTAAREGESCDWCEHGEEMILVAIAQGWLTLCAEHMQIALGWHEETGAALLTVGRVGPDEWTVIEEKPGHSERYGCVLQADGRWFCGPMCPVK